MSKMSGAKIVLTKKKDEQQTESAIHFVNY